MNCWLKLVQSAAPLVLFVFLLSSSFTLLFSYGSNKLQKHIQWKLCPSEAKGLFQLLQDLLKNHEENYENRGLFR